MNSGQKIDEIRLRYPFESRLTAISERNQRLELAAALTENMDGGIFFRGRLLQPRTAASLLVLLPKIAVTRFYTPPNMVARIIALADPVVTCNNDFLRFESLSACCGAYARVDVSTEALTAEAQIGKGTTNVEFNQGLRDALTALTGDGTLDLSVDTSQVNISVNSKQFVEKKVQLPGRWLRGFAEVAAYQSTLHLVYDLKKVAIVRFLNNLPTSAADKAEYYLVMRSGELAITQQKQVGAVKLESLSRFKALKPIIPLIDGCRIYANQAGTSSWVFTAGPYNFEYVISASASRGFSGEGQLLDSLTDAESNRYLASVQASLNWQSQIDAGVLAKSLDTTADIIVNCLHKLASSGLVGYDSSTAAFFHRSLPFNESKNLSANPRLKGAHKIVDGNHVEITANTQDRVDAQVEGSVVTHFVSLTGQDATCTCVWFAKHRGERGPCKHVLAVRIMLEEKDGVC